VAKNPPGGILASHDYHPRWEKSIAAADAFAAENPGEIEFITTRADKFPSWVMVKVGE